MCNSVYYITQLMYYKDHYISNVHILDSGISDIFFSVSNNFSNQNFAPMYWYTLIFQIIYPTYLTFHRVRNMSTFLKLINEICLIQLVDI